MTLSDLERREWTVKFFRRIYLITNHLTYDQAGVFLGGHPLRCSTCKYTVTLKPGLGSVKVIGNITIR